LSPRPPSRVSGTAVCSSDDGSIADLIMRVSLTFAAALFIVAPAVAEAQSRDDCSTPRPPAIGAALGRSSPYFEPSLERGPGTPGSVLSRGGLEFAGRGELPIGGPWRIRIEGAATDWPLERQIYSADLARVIDTEAAGRVEVRQIVASVGRLAGRAPVCGYVLAGGGLYSLNFQGTSHRSPGFALTAGVEFPAGPRGAVQVDVQLHLINADGRYPIGSSTVVDGRFLVGWMYRF
jgi:hypothetical protein